MTLGNAQDFGDLTNDIEQMQWFSSSDKWNIWWWWKYHHSDLQQYN